MDDLTALPARMAILVSGLAMLLVLALTVWGLAGGPVARQTAYDIVAFLAMVLGYNLFTGTTGYISFGHGLFYALGGYSAILLAGSLGGVGAVIAAGLVNAVLAVILLGPLLRSKGPYFSIASLALFLAASGIVSVLPGLGGSEGLTAPPGAGLDTGTALLVSACIAVIAVLASLLVGATRVGKRVIAVRDNEEAARSLGLSPLPYRLAMLALSGFIVGSVGGAYFLSYGGRGYIDPELAFDPRTNVLMVLAAVAGGVGSLTGVLLGALVVKVLDNLLAMYSPTLVALLGANQSEAPVLVTTVTYSTLGLLVALIAVAAPRGIYGLLEPLLRARLSRIRGVSVEVEERSREGGRG